MGDTDRTINLARTWHGLPVVNLNEALTWDVIGGRYWDRTSDLFRVREARYRCANRPPCCQIGLRSVLLDRLWPIVEVEKGFEPS